MDQVNGVLFDLIRPLEIDCTLELLDFEHEEGTILMNWNKFQQVLMLLL